MLSNNVNYSSNSSESEEESQYPEDSELSFELFFAGGAPIPIIPNIQSLLLIRLLVTPSSTFSPTRFIITWIIRHSFVSKSVELSEINENNVHHFR